MEALGWRRRRGYSPAAEGGARKRAALPPASASNTLSCQRETLHFIRNNSADQKSLDEDHGIYRDLRCAERKFIPLTSGAVSDSGDMAQTPVVSAENNLLCRLDRFLTAVDLSRTL